MGHGKMSKGITEMIQIQCYTLHCENVFKSWSRDGWNIYCLECRKKEVEKVMQVFTDIKPCPWCGSKLLVEEKVGYLKPNGEQIRIVCVDCNAKGPVVYGKPDMLKMIWNERK